MIEQKRKHMGIPITFYIFVLLLGVVLSGCSINETGDFADAVKNDPTWDKSYEVNFYKVEHSSTIHSTKLSNKNLFYSCNEKDSMGSTLYSIGLSDLDDETSGQEDWINSEAVIRTEDTIESTFIDEKENIYMLCRSIRTENFSGGYIIYVCDKNGEIKVKIDVTGMMSSIALLQEGEIPIILNLFVDGLGKIYLTDSSEHSTIWIIDPEAESVNELKSEYYITEMAAGEDGSIFALSIFNSKIKVLELNEGKGKFNQVLEMPDDMGMGRFVQSEEGKLYLSGNNSIHLLDMDSMKYEQFFSWTDSGISGYDVESAYITNEKSIFAIVKEKGISQGRTLAVIKPIDIQETKEKEIIVLGGKGISNEIKKYIGLFNVSNPRYQVEISEYSYEDADKMGMEILLGKGPDLIGLNSIYVDEFTRKGLLEDLTPYLENSTILSREDLVENVLKLNTVQGALICIPPVFIIDTVVGRTSQVGEEIGWTIEEFFQLAEQNPKAEIFGGPNYGQSKFDVVYLELMANPDKYVDWSSYTAHFNTPQFIDLLEFADQYETKPPNNFSVDVQIRDGRALLYKIGVWNVIDYVTQKGYFEGEATFIGYPSAEGEPRYGLRGLEAFCIRSGSKVKEGAWEFIEFLITSQTGSDSIQKAFPTLKKSLQEMYEEGSEQMSYINTDHQKVLIPKNTYNTTSGDTVHVYAATLEEIDQINYLIDHAVFLGRFSGYIDDIIGEEAGALFAGQKDAESAAEIIQNRVQLYLDENKK